MNLPFLVSEGLGSEDGETLWPPTMSIGHGAWHSVGALQTFVDWKSDRQPSSTDLRDGTLKKFPLTLKPKKNQIPIPTVGSLMCPPTFLHAYTGTYNHRPGAPHPRPATLPPRELHIGKAQTAEGKSTSKKRRQQGEPDRQIEGQDHAGSDHPMGPDASLPSLPALAQSHPPHKERRTCPSLRTWKKLT